MRKIVLAIATAGGIGLIPVAPGTVGSLLGVALWAGLAALGTAASLAAWVPLAGLAIWASGRAQRALGEDDGRIVIDEVAGQLTALLLLPVRLEVALAGFALFRVFDIWKPGPVRALESLPGGAGVVADDLAAGLLANLAGQLLWRVALPGGAA
jgi:phosphatidylglycerophosphatase A